MNTAQRVIRRSVLLSRVLNAAAGVAVLLLLQAVVRANLSAGLLARWPWKLQLLDIQSATTVLVAAAGGALARAQYARSVRPALGSSGRVVAGLAPQGRLVWACELLNAAQDVAVVTKADYLIVAHDPVAGAPAELRTDWLDAFRARQVIADLGLKTNADFFLSAVGAGRPLPPEGKAFLGWFTEEAMSRVVEVYVRFQVSDRVGDTHERIIPCLKGADRHPTHPMPELY